MTKEERNNAGTVPSWPTMGDVYEGRWGAHTEKWGFKGECEKGMQRYIKSRRR